MPAVPILVAIGGGSAAAGAALVTAGVATGYSIYSGQRAAAAQNKALGLQRQQSALQSAMQKRQAIRQARVAAAASQQTAESTGASTSSAAEGGQGSIFSQLSGNLSFLDQNQVLADQASVQLGKANIFAARSKTADQIAGAAVQVYGSIPTKPKGI